MTKLLSSHSNRSLDEWLSYIEAIHATEIDMGLTRISNVAKRLALQFDQAKVITVAGTNGKGTTCAFLESALLSQNKSVAVYSSPHIHVFNERLRFNNSNIDDISLIKAFELVEQYRENTSLTYYEFTTLAALVVLKDKMPDYIILEVGLGGRLDATNIIDADIAVITTVDLDHQAFLGNDRESIGFEKAGIMRAASPVVIGDSEPPKSVVRHAKNIGAQVSRRNVDFHINDNGTHWCWYNGKTTFNDLPPSAIPRDNIATALQVLDTLRLNLPSELIKSLVNDIKVEGRTELIKQECTIMLDVGHNPLAARYLAKVIQGKSYLRVHAVVAMLADKDIENTLKPLNEIVDSWYVASLNNVPRGATANQLASHIAGDNVLTFDNVSDGFKMAKSVATGEDLILVFGSFFTVAHVKAILN